MSGVSGAAPGLVREARPHIPPVWTVGITSTQRGKDARDPNQMILSSASSRGSRCIKWLWKNIKASIHHPSLCSVK